MVKKPRAPDESFELLSRCTKELIVVTRAMKDMLEVIQNQDDVGEAITSAANITRQEMEGLIHGISATEKGINYYASNLSGFKAEIRNHCQNLKKTLDGISWEWCQPKGETPLHQYLKTTFGHLTKRMDETSKNVAEMHDAQEAVASHQPLILEELRKRNQNLSRGKGTMSPPPGHLGNLPEPPRVPERSLLHRHSHHWRAVCR